MWSSEHIVWSGGRAGRPGVCKLICKKRYVNRGDKLACMFLKTGVGFFPSVYIPFTYLLPTVYLPLYLPFTYLSLIVYLPCTYHTFYLPFTYLTLPFTYRLRTFYLPLTYRFSGFRSAFFISPLRGVRIYLADPARLFQFLDPAVFK